MHRHALRDEQYAKIAPMLPGREGHVGGTAKDNRVFLGSSFVVLPPDTVNVENTS